ncbi:hypothetical protein ACWDKQ_22800 [Saccharopolyspora sp. NPDC000995]
MPEPKGFYTDKNGIRRPIMGKSSSSGVVALAGATALVVSAIAGGGSVGVGASSVAGESVSVRVSNAKQSASKGDSNKAWQRMRLRVTRPRAPEHYLDCVAHSFGEVREFFLRHPCRSLTRTLLPLADDAGNTAVVSIAWVRMPTSRAARELNSLDKRYGTGDVTAVAHDLLAADGIVFRGQHWDSRVKGNLLVRAEATQWQGSTSEEVLDGIAEVATMLPPP